MNIMMNGWLIYQTIVSRLYARTSFYQPGGAFGFRDQLQDVLSLNYINPEISKKQILYHAAHQFEEGDVLHWWHPEKDNGIRTRYSDDLLWLPYVTYNYVEITGDFEILNEQINYLKAPLLLDNESERYGETTKSPLKENLYKHIIRAIEKSLNFGEHGMPLIGGGDWNDGMNEVQGESIWLGFFLYDILKHFSKICELKGDIELRDRYNEILQRLRINLNENAWDGRWFKRAYFKDGIPLRLNGK